MAPQKSRQTAFRYPDFVDGCRWQGVACRPPRAPNARQPRVGTEANAKCRGLGDDDDDVVMLQWRRRRCRIASCRWVSPLAFTGRLSARSAEALPTPHKLPVAECKVLPGCRAASCRAIARLPLASSKTASRKFASDALLTARLQAARLRADGQFLGSPPVLL